MNKENKYYSYFKDAYNNPFAYDLKSLSERDQTEARTREIIQVITEALEKATKDKENGSYNSIK